MKPCQTAAHRDGTLAAAASGQPCPAWPQRPAARWQGSRNARHSFGVDVSQRMNGQPNSKLVQRASAALLRSTMFAGFLFTHRSFSVIPCNHAHYTHTHTRIRPLVAARSHSRSRTRARHPRAAHAHCSHTSPTTSQAASSGSEVLTVHCSAVRGARPVCVLRLPLPPHHSPSTISYQWTMPSRVAMRCSRGWLHAVCPAACVTLWRSNSTSCRLSSTS